MRTAICLTGEGKQGGVSRGRGTCKTPGEGEEREHRERAEQDGAAVQHSEESNSSKYSGYSTPLLFRRGGF